VRPFPTGQGKWQISGNGGLQPKWSRDGTKLYYVESDALMAVPVSTVNGFHPGTPERLFQLNASRIATTTNYDISRNGRVLVPEPVESETGVKPKIHVVVNWFSEFRNKQVR